MVERAGSPALFLYHHRNSGEGVPVTNRNFDFVSENGKKTKRGQRRKNLLRNGNHLIFICVFARRQVVEIVCQEIFFQHARRRLFDCGKIGFAGQNGNFCVFPHERKQFDRVGAHGERLRVQLRFQRVADERFLDSQQVCDADSPYPRRRIALGRDLGERFRVDEIVLDSMH